SVTATALSSTTPLQLPDTAGAPQATAEVEIGANLPANAANLSVDAFDPAQSNTYTASTSITVYDSLGDSHIVTAYFVKEPNLDGINQNTWGVFLTTTDETGATVDLDVFDGVGGALSPAVNAGGVAYGTLAFNQQGVFQGTIPATGIYTEAFGF